MFRDSLLSGVFDGHLPDGIGTVDGGEALPLADLLATLFLEGGELADGPVGAVGHVGNIAESGPWRNQKEAGEVVEKCRV